MMRERYGTLKRKTGFGTMTPKRFALCVMIALGMFLAVPVFAADTPEGTSLVDCHGYTGCIQLENADVRIILDPNCGGRVLEYSYRGKSVIYMDPAQDGWMLGGAGRRSIDPSGGRCDIGPEGIVTRHNDLWLGKWKAEITGARSARLTSVADTTSGFQLVRDFKLDKNSSLITFTQTIRNVSAAPKTTFHWGRTFVEGNGICIVPLTQWSRFPLKYVMYGPGMLVNYRPRANPNVSVRDAHFIVTGAPEQPQFGFDTSAGWLAYITRSNLLFVKRFTTFPDRMYGEVPASTVVIWYNLDQMCELEPMGPLETIKPGKSVSFTEQWWLFPYDYPADQQVDLKALDSFVAGKAK
jgi:hypothetical protein